MPVLSRDARSDSLVRTSSRGTPGYIRIQTLVGTVAAHPARTAPAIIRAIIPSMHPRTALRLTIRSPCPPSTRPAVQTVSTRCMSSPRRPRNNSSTKRHDPRPSRTLISPRSRGMRRLPLSLINPQDTTIAVPTIGRPSPCLDSTLRRTTRTITVTTTRTTGRNARARAVQSTARRPIVPSSPTSTHPRPITLLS